MICARLELRHDAEVRAEEACAEFGDKFFPGALAAVLRISAEVAIDTMRGRRPVHALVRERRSVALGVAEALERRHLDEVERRCVVRLVAAMPDRRADVGEERVGVCETSFGRGAWSHRRVVLVRQAVDLVNAEHGVGTQERNRPLDIVALVVRLGLDDLVGVDHHRSSLAFADVTAEFERLLERHPCRRGETARHSFRPEQHYVDALVEHSVRSQRPRNAPGGIGRIPRSDPRPHAALQVGDDSICDARVDICARFFFSLAHFSDPPSRRPRHLRPLTASREAVSRARAPARAAAQRRTA